MEIRLTVENIDYGALAAKLLPALKGAMAERTDPMGKFLSGVASLPPALLSKTVNALPQETKDDLAVYLINSKSDWILQKAAKLAAEKEIPVRFCDIKAE